MLPCRVLVFQFTLSLHYIALTRKMVIWDTWYNFLNLWRVWKWYCLFFALFVMSNKKLQIQYQEHPHFASLPPLHPPKKSWALCHLCCHFQILCNKRLFIQFHRIPAADIHNQNQFLMQNWSGICPNWPNRSVILASHKNHTFIIV